MIYYSFTAFFNISYFYYFCLIEIKNYTMTKKLLQVITVFFILTGISMFTACEDPNTQEPPQEEPDTPEKPDDPKDTTELKSVLFEIELTDLNPTGVNMRVMPIDYEGGYYFDVLKSESYEYASDNGWQGFLDYTFGSIAEANMITIEEVLKSLTSYGTDEWTFMGLDYNTDYYAVVMGIDSLGQLTSEIVSEPFKTPNVEMSLNTFEITVSNATYNGADYTIVPSNKEEAYFSCIVSKVIADQFTTDEELAAYCMSIFPDVNAMLKKGDMSYTNDGMCQPGREFYVIAFGFESGVVTTPIAKESFATITDGDPATCEFTFKTGIITHDRAEVFVTPSNQFNVFFVNIIATEDINFFMEEYNTTDRQAMMNRYWTEEFLPVISQEMTPAQFADMASIWGDIVGGTDAIDFKFLSKETEYIVYAVCLDAEGNPAGDFHFSEPFTTESEIVSQATADIEVLAYFNGSELTGEYNYKGFAVVVCSITVSEDAVNWYSDLFANDVSSSNRYNLLNNLVGDYSLSEKNVKTMIKIAYWDDPCSALAVAQDADGNYGLVDIEVITCKKSEALKAEEFEKYLEMME